MCGISGILGPKATRQRLRAMVQSQAHRGPDDRGLRCDGEVALGHTRLSVIDPRPAGRQPMSTPDGTLTIVFNGEVYNHVELRRRLASHPFRTRTDTEVVLAAYRAWGPACLDRFEGMFAFAVWDAPRRTLFAARDRFGVKPLHYACDARRGELLFASEIKALHAAGVPARPDERTWATWLVRGLTDHDEHTYWQGIRRLPPGHSLEWRDGRVRLRCWYDLAERTGAPSDPRSDAEVRAEARALLERSVRLRFRADVPVGINLSGGLDSSTLLGLVQAVQGEASDVKAFTFVTGDERYDETPWVRRMLERTRHPLVVCSLAPGDVPELARSVTKHQDEPFGGLPTLAYARLFDRARDEGVTVLLDGQGMDEAWAGYDTYLPDGGGGLVQGTRESPVRPACLAPEFRARARAFEAPRPFGDRLRDLQWRDLRHTKLPRALRYNDRVSMRAARELREPFLDHRLVELALRQPERRKIAGRTGKALVRELARELAPRGLVEAPKRPVQTPQREWLRGPLREWAAGCIDEAVHGAFAGWLEPQETQTAWRAFLAGRGDNSFFVWQWISLGLASAGVAPACTTHE